MRLGTKLSRLGSLGIITKIMTSVPFSLSVKEIYIEPSGVVATIVVKTKLSWYIPQSSDGQIPWDESDERIYLSQSSGTGSAVIEISSDRNSGHRRSEDLEFVAIGSDGKEYRIVIPIKQFGTYDGKYATTPVSEYVRGLDGGRA